MARLAAIHLFAMWSLETLEAINADIEAQAKRQEKQPYQPASLNEIEQMPPYPFPNLGHVPEGWEEVETFFVDKTGLGSPHERALTQQQFHALFCDHVADHPEHAYAITQEGQFQLFVSALQRIRSDFADTLNG